MKAFVSTSSVTEDLKIVKRHIIMHGADFHEHLDISKRDATAMIKYLDSEYHTHNKSPYPDGIYDILNDWYVEHFGVKKKVGAKVKGKRAVKVRLEVPMASQDKLKPGQDLAKFLTASMYVIGDKLDGISLEITYDGGKLISAHTRGDGIIGQDVSGVCPALNVPQVIPNENRFIVRCEFVMPHKHFVDNYSKHDGTGEFATARNFGGGTLTRNVASKDVSAFHVVAYEIVKGRGAGQRLSLQLTILKKYGFNVVKHKLVSKLNEATLIRLHDDFKRLSKYAIDGIIVTKDEAYKVTKDNPKHSKAFKINDLSNSRVVEVLEVEWNDSRHSKSIPRIRIAPIILGGVEVTWLTGHSYYYIQNGFTSSDYKKAQKLGRTLPVRPINVGAMIRVIRSGDVIPYIMEVVKPARKAAQPPGRFKLDDEGVHAIYSKVSTDSKKKLIAHFFNALDVEGLKAGMIDRLYAAGFNTIRKIMRMTVDDLLQLEGFQSRSATKLVESIATNIQKNGTFANLAYASNVFGSKIGTSKLQEVILAIPNIMQLSEIEPPEALEERIRNIKGIANTAEDLSKNMSKFVHFIKFHRLKIVKEKTVKAVSQKLAGKKVILTGVRDPQFVKDLIANGGVEASLKAATHVITKAGTSNNKTAYAEENGIPVMTIEQFRKKFKI